MPADSDEDSATDLGLDDAESGVAKRPPSPPAKMDRSNRGTEVAAAATTGGRSPLDAATVEFALMDASEADDAAAGGGADKGHAVSDEAGGRPTAGSSCWSRYRIWSRGLLSEYSLFVVCFLTVLREGLESVIFLFGVGNASPSSIPISGAIGILCGVSVGVVIYYSGKQVRGEVFGSWASASCAFAAAAVRRDSGEGGPVR